ncbi:hypothetical protein CORC01_04059 [Colletotrichum orchidophilum]|uniref:AB hydrolase-1 domain-containing protein n=1 Tax=Colletotrichum orchidophilum TaxID=1209926 RepID=A0A1G4BH21_9PEZI|nr:uncharacterized protein CORC01_04059 [Colletotrichum orchidophilum]OHF00742.1 hypothetical protein CORC01_04059 [Colletotrichum orchidophilum]
MTTTKPTFIFVPGAWHCTTKFEPVTSQLEALGYPTKSVQLPCFGAEPPLSDFQPDVAAIRQEIEKTVDDGEDVVLFMHSYGGIVGVSLLDMLQGIPLPWFIVSEDKTKVDPDCPEDIFYNDMEEVAIKETIAGLKHHSYQTFYSKLTYPAYKDIPVTYIKCALDKAVPPEGQQQMIDVSGVDVVVEDMETSHSPFLSKPDLVIAALRRSAGESF